MAMDTMQGLFVDEIKDLYSAENQILKALPGMIKAAAAPELANAFTQHMKVTEGHLKRLTQIATQLGKSPTGKKCNGMEGLLKEGKEAIKEGSDPEVLDAALIGAAQKVEHYEISGYGTARTHAMLLGMNQAASLLEQTMREEKDADQSLTDLAESSINAKAANGNNGSTRNGAKAVKSKK